MSKRILTRVTDKSRMTPNTGSSFNNGQSPPKNIGGVQSIIFSLNNEKLWQFCASFAHFHISSNNRKYAGVTLFKVLIEEVIPFQNYPAYLI